MVEPWRRRRWQMAHLAIVHVKGELPANQRIIEGETPLRDSKGRLISHSNGHHGHHKNGKNGHKALKLRA